MNIQPGDLIRDDRKELLGEVTGVRHDGTIEYRWARPVFDGRTLLGINLTNETARPHHVRVLSKKGGVDDKSTVL